jgi:hypothetical protein
MDINAMTGVRPPRNRRLWAVVAIVLPVVVIGGGAAWFIRTYIAPPMVSIAEPTQLASYEPPASTPAEPAVEPASQPAESTSQPAPEPPRSLPMTAGINNTSIWPSVSPAQPTAPAYASASPMFNPPGGSNDASEPIAGPIPLPPPRPRISSAIVRGNVPLPRPRPGATEQD